MKLRICAFASHGGSNLQAIIDGLKKMNLDGEVVAVISNNSKSFALERAAKEGIPTFHVSAYCYKNPALKMEEILHKYDVNLIVLAGYMKKLPVQILKNYENHILNIHPALLPAYGGKGMYGIKVHEAVIENKEQYSGVTVHLVNDAYDEGRILNQVKVVVKSDDTAETLAKRVLKEEHKIYTNTLKMIIEDKIVLQ